MPTITIKSDKPMILIPAEEYESMRETIEILSNQALMEDIKTALLEFDAGESLDLEEFWQSEIDEA